MNDETDEFLIRICLCRHSVGILHLISPRYPPPLPTGRRATSQSALLRGLFNNVKGERRETKWERKRFPGAVGAPSVTFTSSVALDVCVCVRLMALRRANDTPFWQRSLEAQNPPDSNATHVLRNHNRREWRKKSAAIIANDGLWSM